MAVHLPARPIRRRRLGYIPDDHDTRDRIYAAPRATSLEEPIDYRQAAPVPVRDQGPMSRCTGEMAIALLEGAEALAGLPHVHLSAAHPYQGGRRIRQPTGPLFDSGARIRDVLAFARRMGIAPETVWPSVSRTINRRPPPRVDLAGFERSGGTFERILAYDLDSKAAGIVTALRAGHFVGFGVDVPESFLDNGGPSVIPRPRADERIAGGHAMAIWGARMEGGHFQALIRNSWGTGWRDGGYAWADEGFVEQFRDLWIFHGWGTLKGAG